VRALRDVRLDGALIVTQRSGRKPLHAVRHVVTENSRVRECNGRARESRSGEHSATHGGVAHQSLKDDYEVSCPELDFSWWNLQGKSTECTALV